MPRKGAFLRPASKELLMFRTIMAPLNGSPFGEYAQPLALAIARRAGAQVELIHVYTLPIS